MACSNHEFIGSSIQINDVEQENGITRNNFTDIVNVKVINKDGDSETYQINITKFTGLPIVYIETDGSVQINSKDDYVLEIPILMAAEIMKIFQARHEDMR